MPLPIILIFVVLPLTELYFLIQVGAQIGALTTILLSIFTAVLGAGLVRWQGFGVLMRVQQNLSRGEPPALEMMEGAVLMLAGLMLLLPGFLTDFLGFLALIPPVRRAAILYFLKRSGSLRPAQGSAYRVIDGEFRRRD